MRRPCAWGSSPFYSHVVIPKPRLSGPTLRDLHFLLTVGQPPLYPDPALLSVFSARFHVRTHFPLNR